MSWAPIEKIARDVQTGKTTARANIEAALKQAADTTQFQALISTLDKQALIRADEIDTRVKKGEKVGRLAGVPFVAKDNFLVFGADTTAASNILRGFNAPYQSTAIEKLEAEGAICVAKANLDAFAHGSSTENSDFMVTKHPHDVTRVPGGSSGGSAAAVALEIAPFALGSDTGGSIRLPASFTGTVGLKPTFGLVSRYGVVAMASSTDCIGPITKTVEDAALVLDVMAGKDLYDSTTVDRQDDYTQLTGSLKGAKIGVVKEYFAEGLADDVKQSMDTAMQKLKAAGAELIDVSLPSLPLALGVYYIVCPAEVSSNLSRYDGQRYGHYQADAKDLVDSYEGARAAGFGAEAKRRIMIGTYVLSSGYYDAYFKKAALVRTKLIQEFDDVLNRVDFLLGPTAPMTAFKIGENVTDPLQMYLVDIMTVAANLVGVPSISVPVKPAGSMPVGMQLMARRQNDKELLGIARAVEEVAGC